MEKYRCPECEQAIKKAEKRGSFRAAMLMLPWIVMVIIFESVPESYFAYEGWTKAVWAGVAISFSALLFYIRWQDRQQQ